MGVILEIQEFPSVSLTVCPSNLESNHSLLAYSLTVWPYPMLTMENEHTILILSKYPSLNNPCQPIPLCPCLCVFLVGVLELLTPSTTIKTGKVLMYLEYIRKLSKNHSRWQ